MRIRRMTRHTARWWVPAAMTAAAVIGLVLAVATGGGR